MNRRDVIKAAAVLASPFPVAAVPRLSPMLLALARCDALYGGFEKGGSYITKMMVGTQVIWESKVGEWASAAQLSAAGFWQWDGVFP